MSAIYFTTDPDANALLADNPFALIIGLTLYQQIPTQKAFAGPSDLRDRLGGTLDVGCIATMAPEDLEAAFRQTETGAAPFPVQHGETCAVGCPIHRG